MTLANCGRRDDGVVVLSLDASRAAHLAGVMVGDVILGIDGEDVLTLELAARMLRCPREDVVLELAGASRSRLIVVPNPFRAPHNGVIVFSDCACGIGIFAKYVERWKGPQRRGASTANKSFSAPHRSSAP
jgi:hypothetical protein